MEQANKCIKCNVESCKNHSNEGNFCGLDSVTISSDKENPKDSQAVDCVSFEKDV